MINHKVAIQMSIVALFGVFAGVFMRDGCSGDQHNKRNCIEGINHDLNVLTREMENDANMASEILDIAYSLRRGNLETVIAQVEGIAFVKTVVPATVIDSALHDVNPQLASVLSNNLDRWWRYAAEFNPTGFCITNDRNRILYRTTRESLESLVKTGRLSRVGHRGRI